ncbi:MAG: magnesium/cobalt transporter CorA [Candidatus Micrarchaeota archaeon]
MQRLVPKKRSKKAGLPPGTPMHIGDRRAEKTSIRLIRYSPDAVEENEVADLKELAPRKGTVRWVNVDGVHDVELLGKLCGMFGLHPLVLEDIVNTDQRPKVEDFEDYLYIVIRMFDHSKEGLASEQMSIVLGPDFVLSFQEAPGDVFDQMRERIRGGKGKIRDMGPDYLAYALIDAVVDDYFSVIERIGDEIELMEEELVANPRPGVLRGIHHMKTEMILMRKSVWPLREVIASLEKSGHRLIKDSTRIYLRDVYDHTIHVIDTVETFRDMVSGMLDIYLSSVSNRLNEVMKFLTVVGTVFLPLTFITGIYGMNFDFMPELSHPLGYFGALGAMALVALVMLFYFRKKKWI